MTNQPDDLPTKWCRCEMLPGLTGAISKTRVNCPLHGSGPACPYCGKPARDRCVSSSGIAWCDRPREDAQ